MPHARPTRALALAALLTLPAAGAHAQAVPTERPLSGPLSGPLAGPVRRTPTLPARQTASVNLLGLPFGLVAGEYERAVGTSGLAVGVGGVFTYEGGYGEQYTQDGPYYVDADDQRFGSLQAKLKYYPAARGLRGFSVGLTAGLASLRGSAFRADGVDSTSTTGVGPGLRERGARFRATDTRPTVGSVFDYNFLVGRRQRFLIGLGLGARRVLGDVPRDARSVPGSYPVTYRRTLDRTLFDGRFQVGVGF